jgi:hypothetical protein
VAQIQGKPIYSITNVAIIPLSSQADASRAISQAKESLLQGEAGPGEAASEGSISDNETDGEEPDINSVPASPTQEDSSSRDRRGSIAEDVIGKRVRFGRFAASWLSRKTLGLPGLSNVGQDTTERLLGNEKDLGTERQPPIAKLEKSTAVSDAPGAGADSPLESGKEPSDPTVELLPKLLRYTRLIYSSQNFFFAYEYDLSRSLGTQQARNDHLPMHKVVDELVCGSALDLNIMRQFS